MYHVLRANLAYSVFIRPNIRVSAALLWKISSNGGGGESPYVSLIWIRTANAICGNFLALEKLVKWWRAHVYREPPALAIWLYLRYFSVSAALHWKNSSNGGGGESPYVSLIRIRTANAICWKKAPMYLLFGLGQQTPSDRTILAYL